MKLVFAAVAAGVLLGASAHAADRIEKQTFGSGGRPRTCYVYVPPGVGDDAPAPLIVFLHGSGRTGSILLEKWRGLAKKEGIILAGPDANNPQGWDMTVDGPDFIRDVVDFVAGQYPVNRRRVYLFGHSAGAIHGLMFALLESRYFAAAAVHAGALPPETYGYAEMAARKIPLAIWIGTHDALFPLEYVRATRDVLVQHGFNVAYTELGFHTHDYYSRSDAINKQAWAFLKGQALDADPVFQSYQVLK